MKVGISQIKVFSGLASAALMSSAAMAVPVHTHSTNVSSWTVGLGQSNGNFSVTDDLIGVNAIQLGLRGEQRSVGAINPSGHDYVALPGPDPTNLTRAWWNFQFSVGYNGDIETLDSLTLAIRKDAGSNSAPIAPAFDLLALRPLIEAGPGSDGTFSDLYQASQNPTFGYFSPQYDLSPTASFAYFFTLTAVEGTQTVSSHMCVHSPGLACVEATAVPAPGTLALLGASALALIGLRRRRAL